jgi:hypothetical protein
LSAKLITKKGLEPYLSYWINDIAGPAANPVEAEWSARLLAYIHLYGFGEITKLFDAFGQDVRPDGYLFQQFLDGMTSDEAKMSRMSIEATLRRDRDARNALAEGRTVAEPEAGS